MPTLEQYRDTVATACPDLAMQRLRLDRSGQNNDVLIINDEWVFRFPKYKLGIRQLRQETEILQVAHPHLSLAVPVPRYQRFTGQPGDVFVGYQRIAGEPLRVPKGPAAQPQVARQLATFLGELHRVPTAALTRAPRLTNSDEWTALYTRMQRQLFPHMRDDARVEIMTLFSDLITAQRRRKEPPVLIHGDFGPGNILYDPLAQQVTGVIDFGGAGLGDPALDFAGLLKQVGEDFVAAMAPAYPGLADMLPRARLYAGTFALQEALFGVEHSDPAAFEAGIAPYR